MTNALNASSTKRDHLIDLLRFLAATAVALFHFNANLTGNWYIQICNQLSLGVPVFFVISGYCIFIAANHAENPNEFIIRRIFRIFPNYWFSIIVVLLEVLIFYLIRGHNDIATLPKSFKDILATLTLMTSPFTTIRVINWVYWTLTCELFFYIVVFLVLFLPKKLQLLALTFISACAMLLPLYSHGPLFFLGYWPPFGLGIAVYCVLNRQKQKMLLSLVLLFVNAAALIYKIHLLNTAYIAVSLITATLIYLNKFKPLKQNFLSKMGDYSYSMYLLHIPVGENVVKLLRMIPAVQKSIFLYIAADLCSLVIVIYISKIVFRWVEQPGIALGKSIYKQLKTKRIVVT